MDNKLRRLGNPEIDFRGLQIWIHGRQFPEFTGEYWDDNWLRVTVHFSSDNSRFLLYNEPVIHLEDLYGLQLKLVALKKCGDHTADVEFIEPYLHFKFDLKSKGEELRLLFEIPVAEKHEYIIDVSRDDLKLLLNQLDNVLVKYPLIGKP
jgi:hypothetical protein